MAFCIYARKSTESNDRQVLSIEAQVNELKQVARKDKLKIAKVYTESQSAKSTGRPIFDSMIKELKKGKIQGILCWKIDRLTRNLLDGAVISDLLEQGYIQEIRTPMQVYRNNGIDRLMSGIDMLFARKFIDDLSENVKRGLKAKAEHGWMPGRAPLGYKSDQGEKGFREIIPDPELFDLVRRLWDLLLSGVRSVPEILQIANNQWGFRVPSRRNKAGSPLGRSSLYNIFTNPFYYGLFIYQGKEYKGKHKPMITVQEFQHAQELLGRTDRAKPKKYKFTYTGSFRCAKCGSMITSEQKHKVLKSTGETRSYTYYHCSLGKDHNCSRKSITESELDAQIKDMIAEITIPDGYLQWIFKYYEHVRGKEKQKDSSQRKWIEKSLSEIKVKLDNLTNLMIDPENNDHHLLSTHDFSKRKSELLELKTRLESQLEEKHTDGRQELELTKEAFEFALYARVWFEKGNADRKRAIIQKLFSNREIGDQKVLMTAKSHFDSISKLQFPSYIKNTTFEPAVLGLRKGKTEAQRTQLSNFLRQLDDVRTRILLNAKVFADSS